ncbi:dipeptidase PepV [Oceanirhabdus sp. W0125-5]|uniref:dipeptidase PepV n=1 Tax=Oceanirhabdus sp. W0125-5 TaxID=2999116 RepID=UPI0022F33C50|nr:dipeptidase PepV [Oceanirhabdus sp. W0125-5]WBW99737.1 dipeptidase PepV [Oceanirhabdus sp. W0125-5]
MSINEHIERMKDEIINSTVELVKIKSLEGEASEGKPFGEGPYLALEKALEISEKLGFKTKNLDGYVGYAEYGEGDEYVAALGHLDVVPEGDGWNYDPYGGEIVDGKIYGRGTTDDKGPIVAALYGVKAIMDEGLSLSKKIRIIFGTNEETGSKELEYYLEREKPPVAGFTPDADYPLINGEKGITIFDLIKKFDEQKGDVILKELYGGQAANMVPDKCEAVIGCVQSEEIINNLNEFVKRTGYDIKGEICEGGIKLTCIGESAHGSTPELGFNSIMALMNFLGEIKFSSNEINEYITFMNNKIGMNLHGEDFGCYLEDEVSGKLSFNVGVIKLENSEIKMILNLRYPVTKTLDDMLNPVKETIKGTGIDLENFVHQEPLYYPADHPLVRSLQEVYEEETGNRAELISIGGGTYAKEMPNILAFGPQFPGEPDTIHKPNEYITIDNLIKNAKIYSNALYKLAK